MNKKLIILMLLVLVFIVACSNNDTQTAYNTGNTVVGAGCNV